jgi:XTP/dITP diphosphohydrolase
MSGRLVLLSTSPRVAPGLLSWDAWSMLHDGHVVTADENHPLLPYVLDADVDVEILPHAGDDVLARDLIARAANTDPLVFLLPQVGEEGFARALTTLLIDAADVPAVEVLPGSYDLPGARLLDVVATMDRLRSPGGCPWDAEQTHESLMTYLVEETYETIEAIETGDRDHLREELGDLLLQVVFHSRIAAEHTETPWSVDDVAGDIVDKLVRRHPHVFAGTVAHSAGTAKGVQTAQAALTADDVEATWETLKSAEKGRVSAVDGVPMSLPALALAAKLIHRAEMHGVALDALPSDSSVGARLFAIVGEARALGLDAEAELRQQIRRFVAAVQSAERTGDQPDGDGDG